MSIRRAAVRRSVLVLATVVAVLAVAAGPAFAAAEVTSFPAAGATFSCGSTTYTAISGSVKSIYNETTSPSGNIAETGTIVPTGVTLLGSDGLTYSVQGAAWFGGTVNAKTGAFQGTDTEKFTITGANGVVGTVNMVEHFSPNGDMISFNFGTCTPPAG